MGSQLHNHTVAQKYSHSVPYNNSNVITEYQPSDCLVTQNDQHILGSL